MTKGDKVYIVGGRYKGQTAVLGKRFPGGAGEWDITLDGSYNNGIVKASEVVVIEPKNAQGRAKDVGSAGSQLRRQEARLEQAKADGDIKLIQVIERDIVQLKRALSGKLFAKDAACIQCAKTAKPGEHFCSGKCEAAWLAKKYPEDWADMQKRGGSLYTKVQDASFGYIARTVRCPYCGLGYTFTTLERKKEWQAHGSSEPLHPACRRAAKVQAHDAVVVGQRVIVEAGNGAKGGSGGQDFRRLNKDTSGVVTDVQNGKVWVRLEDNPYKWCFNRYAIKGQLEEDNANGRDSHGKAHDSLSFNTLFWAGIIAALIAKHYGPKETVGMGSYDLRTYQPERKTW